MSQQAGDGAHDSQTCSAPYGCAATVRAVADRASMNSLSFVEIQRSCRQENVDCRHDVVGFGRYRMGATFGVELQVTSRISVDSLQARLNRASGAGGKL